MKRIFQIEYRYDRNGNVTSDDNKGIEEIFYDRQNLPFLIRQKKEFAPGLWSPGRPRPFSRETIRYLYDCSGRKLQVSYETQRGESMPGRSSHPPVDNVTIQVNSHRDYCENFIYENDKLTTVLNPEGFFTVSGIRTNPFYYLRDHQGNVRVVTDVSGNVVQLNHYYPFGGLMGGSTGGELQPYKYGGKELDRMHGLDLYDFSARSQDPMMCRFLTMDPLCEKYYSVSPYAYCLNNPVKFVDPDGKDVYRYDEKTGRIVLEIENDDAFDQVGRFKYDSKSDAYVLLSNRRGEAKTFIDNIEKGILQDGINFKLQDNVIPVGGEGQASVGGFESFISQFSDLVGKEINGYYLSENGKENISYVGVAQFKNNKYNQANSVFMLPRARPDLYGKVYQHTDFHTHPSKELGANEESRHDIIRKNSIQKRFPEVERFILLVNGYKPKEY